MKINLLLGAALICAVLTANAQDNFSGLKAPFGLTWGAKKESFENLRECAPLMKTLMRCRISFVPKPLSYGGQYYITLDRADGLVAVNYASKNFINDSYGDAGKSAFFKIKALLTEKYPTKRHEESVYVFRAVYDRSDDFYRCLAFSGCGEHHFRLAALDGSQATINLNGNYKGEGVILLKYESANYSDVLEKNSNLKIQADRDAL